MIKNILQLTNKNIALATPLIIFILCVSIYISNGLSNNIFCVMMSIVVLLLMYSVFLSGWFYTIKLVLEDVYSDNQNKLIAKFPVGVGEYFLSILGGLIVFVSVLFVLLIISFILGLKVIGTLNLSVIDVQNAMLNVASMKAFLISLSKEELVRINKWIVLLLANFYVVYYLFLLYIPVIYFKEKHFMKAFVTSLKLLFSKKIIKTTLFYVMLVFLYCSVSFLSAILSFNVFLSFLGALLNFYFIVFLGIALMYYYKREFVDIKIGQNFDKRI